MADEIQGKVQITSTGRGEVHLIGLTPEEVELLQAAMRGCAWFSRNSSGRLSFRSTYTDLPAPGEDPDIAPFWREQDSPSEQGNLPIQLLPGPTAAGGSIQIQSLCGYYCTEENYAREAEKLESYGFECLRSRRGKDGRFWEIWLLPGCWAATGDLREAIYCMPEDRKMKAAISFLCSHASFGTLSVAEQRAYMPVPED